MATACARAILLVPEPDPKPGRPRTYIDTHLLRLHVYRVFMGWSVERMLRELRRDPFLRKALGQPGVHCWATVSKRSKHLPWRALWQRREQEGEGPKEGCSASRKRYHFDPLGLHNLQRRPVAQRLVQTPGVVEVPVLVQRPLQFQGVSDLLPHELHCF